MVLFLFPASMANRPEYLAGRHSVPGGLLGNIAGASALMQKAVE